MGITCKGALALARVVALDSCNIQKLRLAHNGIRDEGARSLGDLLVTLQELDLDFNKISERCKDTLRNLFAVGVEAAYTHGRSPPMLLIGPGHCERQVSDLAGTI